MKSYINMKKYEFIFDKLNNLDKNLPLREYLNNKNKCFLGSTYTKEKEKEYNKELFTEDMFFIDYFLNKYYKQFILKYYDDLVSEYLYSLVKFRFNYNNDLEFSNYFSFMMYLCKHALSNFFRKEKKQFNLNLVSLNSPINEDSNLKIEDVINDDNFDIYSSLNLEQIKNKCLNIINNLKFAKNSNLRQIANIYINNNFDIDYKLYQKDFNFTRQAINSNLHKINKILNQNLDKENLI